MNITKPAAGIWLLGILLAGCGGTAAPNSPPAQPSPAAPNRPPVIVQPNENQMAVTLHPFSYDATRGGTVFSDPDGDPLTYVVTMSLQFQGLSVVGTTIQGAPIAHGSVNVSITASDGRASSPTDTFTIVVRLNAAPEVALPNMAVLTAPGEQIAYDATQDGSTFVDADGDRLSYELRAVVAPPGLTVNGLHVVGAFDAPGLAVFEIEASDGYGDVAVDRFRIAAVEPEPGAPELPATPYAYDDAELPLPPLFRDSFRGFGPFWDTTVLSGNLTSDAGAALGRVLFYDRRVSITNTHSCASCHRQEHGFAVPERFSSGPLGVPLARNAMALTNARYNLLDRYFGDLRVRSLEHLASMPIEDEAELGNFMPLLVEKLARTDFYPPLFEAAFGTPEVTSERISAALAQFIRALVSFRSKFDLAFHGTESTPPNPALLTAQETRGVDIFNGAAGTACAHCHETGVHLMDTPQNNGLEPEPVDPGLMHGMFRTPSLRNLAVSAPYMHDGRFETLREVIDHYDHGVQDAAHLGGDLREERIGPVKRMNLTEADKDALEAFLHMLTDEEFLSDPRFSDPFQ